MSRRMQPVVHLAVGYLCWAGVTRWRYDRAPAAGGTTAAILGAAIPDLIDKPLAFAGVVPVGRTIGHSLLFAVPLIFLVWVLAARRDRRLLGLAFAVGYLSHIVTDVPWHLLSGEYHELGFLLWSITHMPPYSGVKPLGTIAGLEVTTLWLEAIILVAGVLLWWRDGRPGLSLVKR